jgi:ParB-like chromosome segregation protein Spo0J
MAEHIALRATAALIPYANNPRTHSPKQIAQIAASIREYGFTNPVLVDEQGGIIAGQGRVLAAAELGLDRVPTIELDYLTPAQRRAYVIADNQLALNAGWNLELLRSELVGLDIDGFDLSLTGFDQIQLADLLTPRTEGLTDPDEVPTLPEEPVTQPGEQYGDHQTARTMCSRKQSRSCAFACCGHDLAISCRGPRHFQRRPLRSRSAIHASSVLLRANSKPPILNTGSRSAGPTSEVSR